MRRMGLIKRGLAAALCCMLCVPVIGGLPQPIIAKADTPRASDSDADLKEVRENACKELDEYDKFKESFIPEGKRAEARAAVDAQIKAIKNCNSSAIISERLLAGRATVDSYIPSDAPDRSEEHTSELQSHLT